MSGKKIMLIKPAYETDAIWDTVRTSHPLGLWWIGSALKDRGHQVRILDETVRNGGLEKQVLFTRTIDGGKITDHYLDKTLRGFAEEKKNDFKAMIPEEFTEKYSAFNSGTVKRTILRTGNPIEETLQQVGVMQPDYIGIPVFASCNYPSAMALAKAIKKEYAGCNIVMGGQHATALPQQILSSGAVDYLITGDAVKSMAELVEGKSTGTLLHGGTARMEDFPLLDMELMAENTYPTKPTHAYDTTGRKSIDYMFSKGCFRDCEFCVAGLKENALSTATLARIDEQIQAFKDMGISEIIVQDDALLFKPRQNLAEYLALMKNHGMHWQDNGGIEFESLTPYVMELFLKYQTFGNGRINSLYIPLNPRTGHSHGSVLEDLKVRFSKNFNHIRELRQAGIYVCTSAIIGYPGQDLETMRQDIALHQSLVAQNYVDKSMTFVTSTLPGTALYQKHSAKIVNKNDWAAYSNFVPQSTTGQVSDIREVETLTVKRNQEMNKVQKSYSWGSAFANS
jgi:tRNA A37 methylthiotransferase MiaB